MNATSTTGWAPEPQTRGTIGLIWGCLATIFLCTWNAVHPSVPAVKDGPWRVFWRRVGYMLIALATPEFASGQAIYERWAARVVQAKSPRWSLTQCFFLTMGGFVVRSGGETVSLSPEALLQLLDERVLPWPSRSIEPEILDRSKADWVLKSLALLQATWFVTQVIGRAAQGLPTTTLELFALGIIFCALFTYVAWWSKPLDVRGPIFLELEGPLAIRKETYKRVSLLSPTSVGDESRMPVALTVGITIVFGALHLVGWQFHFPTNLEKWLWRASSIACVILPLLVLVVIRRGFYENGCGNLITWAIVVMYALCRVYMMVEMFVGLRAVPVDVYRTPQWSQYFPSFS
ncbi:hypothetical protein OPT61_g725 [Boeremia exigua]|uniref:Uncharacterized protein n=1 Tax=Boeremia exigua TaxID=749465 RepID=A0ACC2ISW7_9PLEO|nr:hypothetical protein OPT61_g725 [Boeremia exigua]